MRRYRQQPDQRGDQVPGVRGQGMSAPQVALTTPTGEQRHAARLLAEHGRRVPWEVVWASLSRLEGWDGLTGDQRCRMAAEIDRLIGVADMSAADPVRQELAFLRAEDAELLAHARATVAAARDGWPDPVAILAGLLEERGQLPRPDQAPSELLALGWLDGDRS